MSFNDDDDYYVKQTDFRKVPKDLFLYSISHCCIEGQDKYSEADHQENIRRHERVHTGRDLFFFLVLVLIYITLLVMSILRLTLEGIDTNEPFNRGLVALVSVTIFYMGWYKYWFTFPLEQLKLIAFQTWWCVTVIPIKPVALFILFILLVVGVSFVVVPDKQ